MTGAPGAVLPGGRIIRSAVAGTAVFTVVSGTAAVAPDALAVVALVVDLLLFAAGCGLFLVALVGAAGRSRTDELTLSGIWWLSGTAPGPVRLRLLGALGVEIAVGLVTASVRPFTALAFGILVPVYALGLVGLWAVRHGTFSPRVLPPRV